VTIRSLVLAGLLVSGCSTMIGTTVVADRALPPGTMVEPIGLVSTTIWDAHFLWAAPAGKALYEAARQKALEQKGGDVLFNAKVTTTLTSYLMLFYQTEIEIEGTAARIVPKSEAAASR